MKFLIITQYFPPEIGAAQTRLAATAQALLNSGHEVEVVTALPNYPFGRLNEKDRGKFYEFETRNKVGVHRFWLWASTGKAGGRLLSYLSLMVTALAGLRKVKRPDIIFVNSGPIFMGLTGWVYAKWFGAPLVFFVADLWPRSVEHLDGLGARIFLKLALRLEAWIYRESRYVVAVTEGCREILKHEKNVPDEKLLFLPNGVDTQIFHPRPIRQDLIEKHQLQGKKVFTYAGNHGYAHALEKVLEAADLLTDRKDILFLLLGGGSEKERLQDMARRRGIRNVLFLDPVPPEELADYLQLSFMGLVHVRNSPLAEETRPAKMFPMMAMGKAVLFAGFGEGARLLTHCDGGWVTPPENPQALRDKILEVVDLKEEVQRRGQNNLKFVTEKMSFDRLVSDWLKTLRINLT